MTDRRLQGRLGAYSSWAQTSDRAARTAPARQAALVRFEREVDPTGELPEPERRQRAEAARKAHYTRMQLLSVRSRARAKAARREATRLDAEAKAAEQELANPKHGGGAA